MSMKDQEGMNIMYSLSLEKDYYQVDAQLLKEKLSFVYLHGITEDLCNELCTRLIKEQYDPFSSSSILQVLLLSLYVMLSIQYRAV